jgi:ABC-type branched-subunit amino acid transport system substrate-binding protein
MAALNKLGKPDWSGEIRAPITRNFSSRAQMALNLGGLIADGYIAVEAEDAQQVKNIGSDIMALAKPLSVQQDILNRGKSLTEFAEHGEWNTLKEEFDATQNEVKAAMAKNKDQDLITLVTLGAWIRGTEVITDYLVKNYNQAGARLLRQPAIVEYLSGELMTLPKDIRDEPSVRLIRERLVEIETAVSFPRDQAPTLESVKTLNTITADLINEIAKKENK